MLTKVNNDSSPPSTSTLPPSSGLAVPPALSFEKWQACGNDFILIHSDDALNSGNLSGIDEVKLCNRHFGIGADGVIYLLPSEVADVKIKIVNSDGSEAEMCGNGIRCVGMKMAEELSKNELTVETAAGVKALSVAGGNVAVDMGAAELKWTKNITIPSRPRPSDLDTNSNTASPQTPTGPQLPPLVPTYDATFVDVGNPHCVLFVQKVKGGEVERFGRKIELMSDLFPNKTNVEFVIVESKKKIRVRVWERGAGRTLACGTGACASAYAAWKRGLTEPQVEVELDGGTLFIDVENRIKMTGPAQRVFQGVL